MHPAANVRPVGRESDRGNIPTPATTADQDQLTTPELSLESRYDRWVKRGGRANCGAGGDAVVRRRSGSGPADGALHAADGHRASVAELVGASQPEREATYYLGLIMNAYCHADAAEQAQWFGDDIDSEHASEVVAVWQPRMASVGSLSPLKSGSLDGLLVPAIDTAGMGARVLPAGRRPGSGLPDEAQRHCVPSDVVSRPPRSPRSPPRK